MSDDLEARSHHAITHDGETYIKLADASVTFSLCRKDIAAKDAEIARLRSALATARQDALAEIKQDTDELIEQGRQDGMEQAAKIADSCAADWAKSAIGKYINSKWDFQSRAEAGEEIAAAIRAAANEVKP